MRKVRVETKKVLKSVARRRTLKKFGQAKDDGPGPDPATTIVAEDVYMQVRLPVFSTLNFFTDTHGL